MISEVLLEQRRHSRNEQKVERAVHDEDKEHGQCVVIKDSCAENIEKRKLL